MNIKTKLILLLCLVTFINSCTKIEFEGPSIENLYGDFELIEPLQITNKNPQFFKQRKSWFSL